MSFSLLIFRRCATLRHPFLPLQVSKTCYAFLQGTPCCNVAAVLSLVNQKSARFQRSASGVESNDTHWSTASDDLCGAHACRTPLLASSYNPLFTCSATLSYHVRTVSSLALEQTTQGFYRPGESRHGTELASVVSRRRAGVIHDM